MFALHLFTAVFVNSDRVVLQLLLKTNRTESKIPDGLVF